MRVQSHKKLLNEDNGEHFIRFISQIIQWKHLNTVWINLTRPYVICYHDDILSAVATKAWLLIDNQALYNAYAWVLRIFSHGPMQVSGLQPQAWLSQVQFHHSWLDECSE